MYELTHRNGTRELRLDRRDRVDERGVRELAMEPSAQTLPADWLASLILLVGSDRSAQIVAELSARLEQGASKGTQE